MALTPLATDDSTGAGRALTASYPSDSHTAPGRSVKPVSIVVGVVLGATVLLTAIGFALAGPKLSSALTRASFQSPASVQPVAHSIWQGLSVSTLNPWYWAFVAFLTLLQCFWPARRSGGIQVRTPSKCIRRWRGTS